MGYVKKGEQEELKRVFEKYASITTEDGEKFMTDVDLLVSYLGLFPEEDYNRKSLKLMCGVLDASKDE